MKNILDLSLKLVKQHLLNGEISAETLAIEALNRCKRMESLNAYVTLCESRAMEMARNSYNNIINKTPRALEGIPICIKDMFCTKGVLTTACSRMLPNFIPTYESSVTKRAENAGCVFIGKTSMDEFAMGSSNERSCYGPVKNPWNQSKVPGGSSGGTAAAVAAGLAYAGFGSDTGGSVRQPAALCGIVGIKPSYGRCSRHGMIAYASSFDQAGVMARSVEDACMLLDEVMGPCAMDSKTIQSAPPRLSDVKPKLKGKRIAYFSTIISMINGNPSAERMWKQSLDALKAQGAEVFAIDPSVFDSLHMSDNPMQRWIAIYYTLTPAEVISNLARFDGIRYGSPLYENGYHTYESVRSQFGYEVQRRILLGSYILSTKHENQYFQRALLYRRIMQQDFQNLFKKFDAIISPTSMDEAWDIGHYKSKNKSEMYLADIFTVLANLINTPAISIPVCLGENNLPMGLQIMCDYMNEVEMIEIALALEDSFNFAKIREQELKVDRH